MLRPHRSLRRTAFLSHLYIKTNILPRQARDKHRENSKNDRFVAGARNRPRLFLDGHFDVKTRMFFAKTGSGQTRGKVQLRENGRFLQIMSSTWTMRTAAISRTTFSTWQRTVREAMIIRSFYHSIVKRAPGASFYRSIILSSMRCVSY